jgi:hypothetical protein
MNRRGMRMMILCIVFPDRTIDGLMRRLAFRKGDNIVRELYIF